MGGKHQNWHKRWTVDLSAGTATHDSGLIVRFVVSNDTAGAWDGSAVNAEEWFASIKDSMPPRDLEKHAARLLREAGDAYLYQLNRRH